MEPTRRPIAARNTQWAAATARFLAAQGIRPNVISVASAFFAAGAGGCLWLTENSIPANTPWLFLGAAALMQMRLLCNLFDGMVAVEGGFKTKSGEVFNELPDRFADLFIFAGAGYAVTTPGLMPWLGWAAAALAILTAYVRALGASAGASQHFCGPMAKQHRMAVMTVTCLLLALAAWMHYPLLLMTWSLVLVIAGCLTTTFRRAFLIIQQLESR
jgi:phosphatidylglycerophosphate synthase